jgi:hypothetical protein
MSIPGAVVAGILGTLVMTLLLAMGPSAQAKSPRIDMAGFLGSLFSPRGNRVLGWALHLAGGVIAALIYAALWDAGIGAPGVTMGGVFGAIHWLIAGLLIGALSSIHAGARAGTFTAPGYYLRNMGGSTGFIAGLVSYIAYGLTVGLVYGLFKS